MRSVRTHVRVTALAACAAALAAGQLATAPVATATAVDGRILYLTSPSPNGYHIVTACADGSNPVTITSIATEASWSSDGSTIFFARSNTGAANDGLWKIASDVASPALGTQLTGASLPTGYAQDEWPTPSPDGTKLAFYRETTYAGPVHVKQPWVLDLASGTTTQLLSSSAYDGGSTLFSMSWTPDGKSLLFGSLGPGSPDGSGIYRVSSSGGTPVLLVGGQAQSQYTGPSVSPDGTTVVAEHSTATGGEGWAMNPDGTGGHVLASSMLWPTWSPSGSHLVYARLTPQGDAVYTSSPTATSEAALGVLGDYPRWGTDTHGCSATTPPPTYAGARINEVALSSAGHGPFVELADATHEGFPTASAPYRLVAFDANGKVVGRQDVPTAALQSADLTSPFLLATGAVAAAYGVTPKASLSIALPATGQLCFTAGAAEHRVSCVRWGCVWKAVDPAGPWSPVPGSGRSTQRQGVTSAHFALAAPTPAAANAAGTSPVACSPPRAVGAARLSYKGRAVRGTTLHVVLPRFVGGPKVSYQWLRAGKTIAKATGASYRLVTADRGRRISVRLVAVNPGGRITLVTSTVLVH